MRLLLFVIIWDTTVEVLFFFSFLKDFIIKKKTEEWEWERKGNREEKNGLLYFWASGVSCECILGTITLI